MQDRATSYAFTSSTAVIICRAADTGFICTYGVERVRNTDVCAVQSLVLSFSAGIYPVFFRPGGGATDRAGMPRRRPRPASETAAIVERFLAHVSTRARVVFSAGGASRRRRQVRAETARLAPVPPGDPQFGRRPFRRRSALRPVVMRRGPTALQPQRLFPRPLVRESPAVRRQEK